MRDPTTVWESCADDERWATEPEAMVAEILREGFESGVEAAAICIGRTAPQLPAVSAATGAQMLARAVRALTEPEPEPEDEHEEEAAPCDSAS